MKILVGFSGGVDSAMTAALLRERGHQVTAAMMSVCGEDGAGCGSGGDAEAARALAEYIGIPFTVVDCSGAYREQVLEYFRAEYLAGRTPNPCVRCNPTVKFSVLPALARAAGADFDRFATGHYAQLRQDEHGRTVLCRGVDHGKDQSYFLYRLSPEQLAGVLFPLGEFRKEEVRAMAEARGLPVHDKPDSQDFHAGDYADLLNRADAEGDIVDLSGAVLGKHDGYWRFTPGQRKGLGVAYREPLYVIRVEPEANRVVVGTRAQQLRDHCRVGDLVFHRGPPAEGAQLSGSLRSSQPPHPVRVGAVIDGAMTVHFAKPQQGVAPGQSLVLYDGEEVVGGGIIAG